MSEYPVGTTMIVAISEPGGAGGSIKLELADEFEEVLDKVWSLTEAISAEAFRLRALHTLTNGKKIMVHPTAVGLLVEGELPIYGL